MADKYEINLQEVAKELENYLDKFGQNYDIYTEVKSDNCVYVLTKKNNAYVLFLEWYTEGGWKWENRWKIQMLNRQIDKTKLYKVSQLLNDLDDFLNDWYAENPDPDLDINDSLLEDAIAKVWETLSTDFNKFELLVSAKKIDDNSLTVLVKNNHLVNGEPGGSLRAVYYIKKDSIRLISLETHGDLMEEESHVTKAVRQCVEARLANM